MYLRALSRAVPVVPGTFVCSAHVFCSWGFPGPLLRGAVVIKVPAILILVGLPVAQDVKGGAGGGGRQGALCDLQLLEIGVDGGLRVALA